VGQPSIDEHAAPLIGLAATIGQVDPAAAVLAFIGLVLAIPSAMVALTELRKTRAHSRLGGAKGRRHRIRHGAVLLSVIAAGLASLVVSAFVYFTAPAPSTCTASQAANVSATLSGSDLEFVIHISCPPPAHYQYVLIGEPRDVDVDPTNPHPEYYLTWQMGRPGPGDYQHLVNGKNIQGTTEVTYFIISLDDNGFAQLRAQRTSRNFVLNLPQSHTVVSNREVVKR
jgi:hypothetical protein